MKTIPNDKSVIEFIQSLDQDSRRSDAFILSEMFKRITGEEAVMWGDSIVGFGKYHYRYDSGREGEFLLTGFSPRKQHMALYLMNGCERYQDQLMNIGKHKTGSSCLYLKRISDVDLDLLEKIIEDSVEQMRKKYN